MVNTVAYIQWGTMVLPSVITAELQYGTDTVLF